MLNDAGRELWAVLSRSDSPRSAEMPTGHFRSLRNSLGERHPASRTCSTNYERVAMLNIVLVEPEIPQNTGNIARTCACVGARLHLVEPMGFRLTEKNLRRAGCDYWDDVEVVRWPCVEAFLEAHGEDELHLFTGQAYRDVVYGPDAFLLFGRESRGLDQGLIDRFADCCRRIPMREGARSLNLSNAVAIAAYDALAQRSFPGLV